MSDINTINVSLLKNYKNDFSNEKTNFNNNTYNTYSSSYFKRCSDPYISRMDSNLQRMYDKLKKGYINIDTWWSNYNENLEALENSLTTGNGTGAISESGVRSCVSKLSELKDYDIKFAGVITPAVNFDTSKISFASKNVTTESTDYSSLFAGYNMAGVGSGVITTGVAAVTGAIGAGAVKASKANKEEKNINRILETSATVATSVNATVTTIEKKQNIFQKVGSAIANGATSLWNGVTSFVSDVADNVGDFLSDVGATIANGAKEIWSGITNWWDGVTDWWSKDALPWLESAANAVWDVVKSAGATIAVAVQSLVKGIGQFGEALVDVVVMVGGGVASVFTGAYDLGQAIGSAITGAEWSSATKAMWTNGLMPFVAKDYVGGWFDALYQTGYGKWLDEHSLIKSDSIGANILSGVGYIAGMVALTIATLGIGTAVSGAATAGTSATSAIGSLGVKGVAALGAKAMGTTVATIGSGAVTTTVTTGTITLASTAAVSGFGRGTASAWSDGAELGEGLLYGGASGIWEGIQFFIGGSVNKLTIGTVNTLGKAVMNSAVHVGIDAVTGGLEGFVQPGLQFIYKGDDGYSYAELFEMNGGWITLVTQAGIGGLTSTISEVFEVRKIMKDLNNGVIIKPEVVNAISQLEDTFNTKKLDDIIDLLGSKEKGINGKVAGAALFSALGLDDTPKLVDINEFVKTAADSEYGIILRGISGEDALKYVDQFKNGEMYVGGGNGALNGTGIYGAYGKDAYADVAQKYATGGGLNSVDGAVMKMILSDDAKIIDMKSLLDEQNSVLDQMAKYFSKYDDEIINYDSLFVNLSKITDQADLQRAKYITTVLADPGLYASMRGYDAIDIVDKQYLVITNRGKVIMEADAFASKRIVDTLGELLTDSEKLSKFLDMGDDKVFFEGMNRNQYLDQLGDLVIASQKSGYDLGIPESQYKQVINLLNSRNISPIIEIATSEFATIKMLKISELVKPFMDDEAWSNFTTNFDNSKHIFGNTTRLEYAIGIKQFMETCKANGYDMGLNQYQEFRANYIINNFYHSAEEIANGVLIKNIFTNNIQERMLFNDNPKIIFSDDFKNLISADSATIAKKLNDAELDSIISRANAYEISAINSIVSRNLDLSNSEFSYIAKRLYETDNLNAANLPYLNNLIKNGYILDADLKKVIKTSYWASTDMIDRLKMNFGGYVDSYKFSGLDSTFKFVTDNDFINKYNAGDSAMAFNNGTISVMNIKYADEILASNVSHETLHQISNNGNGRAGLGLSIFDVNKNTWNSLYTGLNEATTEYLNSINMNDLYPRAIYCGYQAAVEELKALIKIGAIDETVLKQAYFSNDIDMLARNIVNNTGSVDIVNKLIGLFDNSISSDSAIAKPALKDLRKMVKEIALIMIK